MRDKQKHTLVIILVLLLSIPITFISFMKIKFNKIGEKIRGCDAQGCGYFGASRGSKTHQGIDLIYERWTEILAPFKLKILRFGKPYADVSRSQFDLVEFTGFGVWSFFKFKLMYVDAVKYWDVGKIIEKGSFFCNSQDIAGYYGGGMTNHVHLECRFMGKLINPTKLIKLLS